MNRYAIILTICAFYTALCCAQSNVVYYGINSNALDVVFVDTNLSAKVKSAIVADLNLCLQAWGKTTEFRLGADDPAFFAHLHNPKICPHYPEGIEFPEDIMNTPDGPALLISKELSDAYTNAFAFAVANTNAVKAAYEFVRFVSSTNFHNVTSKQISNYVLYNKATPKIYELSFSSITNSLRMQTYYPPSVLGFYYSAEGPATKNLWMLLPSSSPDYGGHLDWSPFPPAIWHNGKWKFCAWEEKD